MSDERRFALVIGNGGYRNGMPPLANATNDARLIATTLRSLDFKIVGDSREAPLIDADRKLMLRAVRDFGEQLRQFGASAVGLFYYAGHAIQSDGKNYLLPADAQIETEDELEGHAVSSNFILTQMALAKAGMNLLILDACRDNPFRGVPGWMMRGIAEPRGLAPLDATHKFGTLIQYAAAPGEVAFDGDGANSPFTSALAKAMLIPDLEVAQVFRKVRGDVVRMTNNRQRPWESSSMIGDFYFVTACPPLPNRPQQSPPARPLVNDARTADDKRKATEAHLAEEQRKAIEARIADEKRKAEEVRAAEKKREADEARATEERKRVEAAERVFLETSGIKYEQKITSFGEKKFIFRDGPGNHCVRITCLPEKKRIILTTDRTISLWDAKTAGKLWEVKNSDGAIGVAMTMSWTLSMRAISANGEVGIFETQKFYNGSFKTWTNLRVCATQQNLVTLSDYSTAEHPAISRDGRWASWISGEKLYFTDTQHPKQEVRSGRLPEGLDFRFNVCTSDSRSTFLVHSKGFFLFSFDTGEAKPWDLRDVCSGGVVYAISLEDLNLAMLCDKGHVHYIQARSGKQEQQFHNIPEILRKYKRGDYAFKRFVPLPDRRRALLCEDGPELAGIWDMKHEKFVFSPKKNEAWYGPWDVFPNSYELISGRNNICSCRVMPDSQYSP